MKNKFIVALLVVLLTITYTLIGTYAVIINVKTKDGINEIVGKIEIKDLLTNDDGNFNNTYYTVKNTLNVDEEEMKTLMTSSILNEKLQVVLNSIVEYKINNNQDAILSNSEIYNLIVTGVEEDTSINTTLKDKVIKNSNNYIQDISTFLYDIEVSKIKG